MTALFLREALNSLGEIIGVVTTDDILNKYFQSFVSANNSSQTAGNHLPGQAASMLKH